MRINTLPLPVLHRDMMNRVIRLHDHVAWSNGKYGQRMRICQVVNASAEKVSILPIGGHRATQVYPNNLLVITAQIERNLEGNVGANMDIEATR